MDRTPLKGKPWVKALDLMIGARKEGFARGQQPRSKFVVHHTSSWTAEKIRLRPPSTPEQCPRWLGIAVHDRWNKHLSPDKHEDAVKRK